MSAMKYVALCAKDKTYLKITNSGYFTTKNAAGAFRDTEAQVHGRLNILRGMGFEMKDWIVMRSKDASKIVPGLCSPDDAMIYLCNAQPNKPISFLNEKSKELVQAAAEYTTPATQNANSIVETVKQLQSLISTEHTDELSKKLSQLDKYIVDAYHYIEVSNLNAAQGYKAYKRLKEVLVARRKVKNELAVILRIHQCGVRDMDKLAELSTRAWEPQVDLLAEV